MDSLYARPNNRFGLPYMMDLNDIVVFARVAKEQSFTKAALALGMPKSTVSERVARLESKLGVRLLERTTRSLRLTASGTAYFDHVARIVAELEAAEAAVTAAHKVPRGLLRVGSALLLAQVFLAELVSEYLGRYPDVQVEMIVADRAFDVVEEGLDVAVHVLGPMDAQVVARKLGIGGRVCVASPSYLARRPPPETPADLAEHDCVVVGPTRHMTWPFERDSRTHALAVTARYAVSSVDLAQRAVLAGHGVSVLPEFLCATDMRAGRLVRLSLDGWTPREVVVHLVYPSHRHLSARVRSFVDLVVVRLPGFPLAGIDGGAVAASALSR